MCIFYSCPHERTPTPPPEHAPNGFNYRGLNSMHAIESPEIRPWNLANMIHPIFRKENFKTGRAVYSILKPALQLASLFITEDSCLDWWHGIRYGQRYRAGNLPQVRSIPNFPDLDGDVIVPPSPCGPQQRANLKQVLMQLAEHITIGWGTMEGSNHFGINIKSQTDPFAKAQKIFLHPDFMNFIQGGGYFAANPAQQARFQFFFAVNLTHELAHTVFDLRNDADRYKDEYYYLPDIEAGFFAREIGASWERFMFGCKIQPISGHANCAHGLMSFPDVPRYPKHTVVFNGIPMDYVWEILTRDIWGDVRQFGARTLRCPETHAKSRSGYFEDEIAREQIPLGPEVSGLISAAHGVRI